MKNSTSSTTLVGYRNVPTDTQRKTKKNKHTKTKKNRNTLLLFHRKKKENARTIHYYNTLFINFYIFFCKFTT